MRRWSGLKTAAALLGLVVLQRAEHALPRPDARGEEDAQVLFTDPFTGESKTVWQLLQWRSTAEGSWTRSGPGPGTDLYTYTGVYQITGGTHHSLLVVMDGYIVIVEAPLNDRRSRRVIAAIKRRWPTKPICYVINTHLDNDLVGGLRTYVAEGATVITAAANRDRVAQLLQDLPVQPDTLQVRGQPHPVVIETVAKRKVLTHGERSIEIYPVENSHAEGMQLIVYLPEEKLLFASDLFIPGSPQQNPVWAQELLAAITHLDLKVDRIAAGHGRLGSLEELRWAAAQRDER